MTHRNPQAGVLVDRVLPLVVYISMVLVGSGCASSQMQSSGSSSGDYLTFPVSDGVLQYFIRPAAFTAASGSEECEIDFTFREGERAQSADTVTANFTIVGSVLRKRLERLKFGGDSTVANSISVQTLFSEADGDVIRSRYSAKLPRAAFYAVLRTAPYWLEITSAGATTRFDATSATQRELQRISTNLIRVIEAP